MSDDAAPIQKIDTESLTQLAIQTKERREALWNEIGVPQDEREQHERKFNEKVAKIFEDVVNSQLQMEADLKSQITSCQDDIAAIQLQLQKEMKDDNDETSPAKLQTMPLRKQLKVLQAKKARLEKVKAEQTDKMRTVLDKLHAKYDRLGVETELKRTVGHDITEARLVLLQGKLTEATALEEERVKQVQEVVAALHEQYDVLLLEDEPERMMDIDRLVIAEDFDSLGVHITRVRELEERSAVLEQLQQERAEEIQALVNKIKELWETLHEKEEHMKAFMAANMGLSKTVVTTCRQELERLKVLKQASLKSLIARSKERLTALWDETRVPESERRNFVQAYSPACTDEVWESIKAKIKEMEARLEKMRPLLKLYKSRCKLMAEKKECDKKNNDPGRFKVPKLIPYLAKFDKRFKRQFPLLTNRLLDAISQWEEEHGDFLIDGKKYSQTLKDEFIEHGFKPRVSVTNSPARPSTSSASSSSSAAASSSCSSSSTCTPKPSRFGKRSSSTAGASSKKGTKPGRHGSTKKKGGARQLARSSTASKIKTPRPIKKVQHSQSSTVLRTSSPQPTRQPLTSSNKSSPTPQQVLVDKPPSPAKTPSPVRGPRSSTTRSPRDPVRELDENVEPDDEAYDTLEFL